MTISPCSRTGPIRAAVPSADGCEAWPATGGTVAWCWRFEDAIALEVAGLTSRAHT